VRYEGDDGGEDDNTIDSVSRWIYKQVIDKACSVSTVLKPVTFVLTWRFWGRGGGVGGGTSGRSKMQQMMLESVNQLPLTCKIDVQWQRYSKPVRLWRAKCSSLLMNETCFPHRNRRQLMETSCDCVMRVQHVRKWCKEFENGRMGIYDTNRISRPRKW
jgi:hypothetical protein